MSTNYTFPMCHLAAPRATLFFLWSKKKNFLVQLDDSPTSKLSDDSFGSILRGKGDKLWLSLVGESQWNHRLALLEQRLLFQLQGASPLSSDCHQRHYLFLWMISACINLIQRSNSVGRQECRATRLRSNGRFRWILTIASLFWNSCKGKQLKDRVVYLDFGLAEAFL